MTRKHTTAAAAAATTPNATDQTTTTAAEIKEMDATAEAALAGIKTATTAAPVVDIKAAAARVNAAVMQIMTCERNVSAARLEELPHVLTVKTDVGAMGAIWQKTTTTQTVKDEIKGNFPAYAHGARSASEAIYWTLNFAGLANGTAKNLLAICDKPVLVALVKDGLDGVNLPLTAAYKLATSPGMDDDDYNAAAAAAVTVQTMGAWIDQRNAAKTVRAHYGAFLAAKAANEAAAARVAWTNAAAAFTKATTPPYAAMVKSLDNNVHEAMLEEMNRRARAARDEAAAAQERATATTTAAADAKILAASSDEAAKTAEAARVAAVQKAKDLESETTKIMAAIEAAGQKATAEMRDKLAALTRQSAEAAKDAEAAKTAEAAAKKAAAEKAADATTLESKAALAQKAAAATTEKAAAAAAQTGGRPTGATLPELIAAYKTLDKDRLNAEIAEIAAELTKAKKLAHIFTS